MKSILIIVPFEDIYPPKNGGMQRCFHIISQLAKHFKLTAIILQDKETFLRSAEEYPEIRTAEVYSTKDVKVKDVFSILPLKYQKALRYRWYKKELKGPADGRFLQYYPMLTELLKKTKFDCIVLENLASLNAVSVIRRYDKKIKLIYDAHNVDSNLAKVAVEKWSMSQINYQFITQAERTLYKTVDAIFACSKNDLTDFENMNEQNLKGFVIPNGVSISNKLFDAGVQQEQPEYVLFCGALWSVPNSEGILWFYNRVWHTVIKTFPNLKLLIVGSGEIPASMHELIKDSSVRFTGTVDDVRPWYNAASISIVPLLSGSGTRLKILEAMSFGLPVLSTSKGAEGIHYTNENNIIIKDDEESFAEELINLLRCKKRISLQQEARKMVERNYDWNVIGQNINAYIQSFINNEN